MAPVDGKKAPEASSTTKPAETPATPTTAPAAAASAEAPSATPDAAHAAHAETVAGDLLSPEGLAKAREHMSKQARIDEAKEKIYDMIKSRVDTPHGEMALHYVKIALVYPLERLELKMDGLTPDQLVARIDNILKSAAGYLDALKNSGYENISPEKLAEAQASASKKATHFSKLLAVNNEELVNAFQASVGQQGKEGSVAANLTKARANLPDHIAKWLDRGEEGMMPCIWMILGFMESKDRVAVAQAFIQKNQAKTEKFLEEGNRYGVFTLREMETIRGNKYDNDDSRAKYATNWEANNNFVEKGKRLAQEIPFSRNDANRTMTIGNGLILAGKVAAAATVGANVVFGMWKNDAWKNPVQMVTEMGGNEYIWLGGGTYAVLDQLDEGTAAEEYLADSDTRDIETGRRATEYLYNRLNGGTGEAWQNFFKEEKYAGLRLFTHYADQLKIAGRLDKDHFTVAGFLDFLDREAAGKSASVAGTDTAKIKQAFEEIGDSKQLVELARALALLNINEGKDGIAAYQKFIKDNEIA